jgi:hypothetical protein
MLERATGCKNWLLDSGSGDLVVRLCVFGVDAYAKKGNGQSAEHSQADAGKRVPAQVDGAQADGQGPEERRRLEDVKHDLPFHNLPSILVFWQPAGDKKQGVRRNGSNLLGGIVEAGSVAFCFVYQGEQGLVGPVTA